MASGGGVWAGGGEEGWGWLDSNLPSRFILPQEIVTINYDLKY